MTKLAARSEELTVRVGDMVVLSQVGAETGLDGTTIARDVVGGWRRSAQVNDVYCISINPNSTPLSSDREAFDRDRVAGALKNALRISDQDVDDLLDGSVAVLLPLDGTNYFVLQELLRALNLPFRLYTVAIAK